jgi:hypothetical protein
MDMPTESELGDLWAQLQKEKDDKCAQNDVPKDVPKDVIDLTLDSDDEDQPASAPRVSSHHVKPEPKDAAGWLSTDVDEDSASIQDIASSGIPGPAATGKPSRNRSGVG